MNSNKSRKTIWSILPIAILVIGLVLVVVCILMVFGVVDSSLISGMFSKAGINSESEIEYNSLNTDGVPEDYIVEFPDIEEFFEENSEVVSVIDVSSSQVLTEEAVESLMTEIGFDDYPITSCYSIEGEYYEATEVTGSTTTHPMYEVYYVNECDELWVVNVIDNMIMATPVSYNMQSDTVPMVVSETNEIVSYDSSTNRFYRTIPNTDVVNVLVVERIDSETLNSLTVEVISNG